MRPRSPWNSALNVAVLAAAAGTTRAFTASAMTSTSGILRIELLRVCSAGSADGFVPKVAPCATDPLPTGYRRRGSSFGSARGRRISRPGGNTDELAVRVLVIEPDKSRGGGRTERNLPPVPDARPSSARGPSRVRYDLANLSTLQRYGRWHIPLTDRVGGGARSLLGLEHQHRQPVFALRRQRPVPRNETRQRRNPRHDLRAQRLLRRLCIPNGDLHHDCVH